MKYLAVLLIFLSFTFVYGQWSTKDARKRKNAEAVEPKWHWIELPLDHFNVLDNRTYKARYLTNDQFYKKGGPIIVYIGGEWEIADYGVMGGVAFQLAKKHNGYLFYPEHRYFGKSLPFPKPVSTENLRYITPDFSLADLVYSTSYLKQSVDGLENSQVLLVGGSYAGALATWSRLKYPHIMSAAYACGGVINTYFSNTDYFHTIYEVLKKTSHTCLQIVLSAHREAEELAKSIKGYAKLENMWANELCINPEGRFNLLQLLIGLYNSQVWPVYQTLQFCHFLESNTTGSALERFLQAHVAIKSENLDCQPPDREWYFLVCTFIGNIQSTNSSNFGNIILFSQQLHRMCTHEFGPQMSQDYVHAYTQRTVKLFGSNHPDVTKVLSVQGTHDPWRTYSILDELNEETPVVYIEEATHCLEMGEEQDDETPQISQSKFEILNQLSKWIV